jgi:hypothetical protein
VEKLNEQTKNYVRIGAIVLGIIIFGAAGWFLFRGIPNNSGSAGDVTNKLDHAAGEQRKAQDALSGVQSGLDDGLRTISGLEQSNSGARQSAGGIAESNKRIKAAVDNAQAANGSSADILADSQRRISE